MGVGISRKMKQLSDEELMGAYSQGNDAAFSELYVRYESKILQFIKHRIFSGKAEVISDLFQLVWLKVHQSRASFDTKQKFSPWVFAITNNSIRDLLGSGSVRFEEATLDPHEVSAADEQQTSTESKLIRSQSLKSLYSLLDKLPPQYREAILLCDIEEQSTRDASKILGVSEVAIRQLLVRGRRSLKELAMKEGVSHE